ncbi:MAG: VWA domain-containing protein [Acidobacteriota bacterium]
MDQLADLGRTLGFSLAAGINLYATVALVGLASRFGWVDLPPQYKAFDSDLVIYTAIALYVVEFLADKIPWVDSAWDTVHTLIRPLGGALIAVTALGDASPAMTALAALVGGVVAGSSHVTKAGTRVLVNTSPEPFSNWALSLGEDAFVVGLGYVALRYPLVALGVALFLLALIVVFAATLIRAFRRRFGRSPEVASGSVTLLVVASLALVAQQPAQAQQGSGQASQKPAQQAPQRDQGQQPPPVFRAGANFVRVDAYPTKDGRPVEDLTAAEFEIYEDGVLQKVETFERVKIQAGGPAITRVEPRSVQEANQMAADPRARLFVLFLDTHHVQVSSSMQIRRHLMTLLQRIIAQDDFIAIMTPAMSAADLMFTRRTDQLQDILDRNAFWGERFSIITDDPVEKQYEMCYPPGAGERGSRSWIAQEMIDRRREVRSLDALEDLVVHLEGIREERKAILLISEGYLLYRPNRVLAEAGGTYQRPGIYVGPDGRIETTDRRNTNMGADRATCDSERIMLSNVDNQRRFFDLTNVANRANSSFYPVEPRGLVVFDTNIGPNPPPPPSVDYAMLRARHDALRVLADNTDGMAVMDSNDIDAGLKRVVDDLSSYYLLGYTTTNTKLDGRYRSIRVRVKRPGVDVRARRGYQAPTEEEVAARAAAPSAESTAAGEAAAAITRAVSSLDSMRPGAVFRFHVSQGWWTPAGGQMPGKPAAAEPALWVFGEVDVRRQGADDWSKGGEAQVAILGKDNAEILAYSVPIEANGRFATRFPRSAEDVWLDPGGYAVRVRVRPATGGIPSTDTSRFELPAPPGDARLVVGSPIYYRRGRTTGPAEVVTSDLRFRRTERVAVELSLSAAPDAVSAELLDRRGRPIAIVVAASTSTRDDVQWVRGEVTLAPLAAGDYVLRITAKKGSDQAEMLAAFRIVN